MRMRGWSMKTIDNVRLINEIKTENAGCQLFTDFYIFFK